VRILEAIRALLNCGQPSGIAGVHGADHERDVARMLTGADGTEPRPSTPAAAPASSAPASA